MEGALNAREGAKRSKSQTKNSKVVHTGREHENKDVYVRTDGRTDGPTCFVATPIISTP